MLNVKKSRTKFDLIDKSIVSMRDLSARMKMQRINVNTSTFSKASKIRETEPFEKIINKLNKSL
ncbi:conserved hypothetical protein [Microcystis aeruginosa PCC 9806]|uniref:Uncharacterized protein n=1 Tax=Microcystis aeruginosa PCC 9806 TaxID=1160282 RepID=I4GS43_MICAE|nr:conserved hypothetical protein [Microcystis aeruginosa PCC 9806]